MRLNMIELQIKKLGYINDIFNNIMGTLKKMSMVQHHGYTEKNIHGFPDLDNFFNAFC